MLEHSEEGALGLIINRPMDTDVGELLPAWARLAADPGVVFEGGPVGRDGLIALFCAQSAAPSDGWSPVTDDVGVIDLEHDPDGWPDDSGLVRMFSGHSGWAGGQLDAEIDAGGWLIVNATADDAVTADPRGLWQRALERLGGRAGWLANYPDDPAFN